MFTNSKRDRPSKTRPVLQSEPSENSEDFVVRQDTLLPNSKPAPLNSISGNENSMNTIQPNQYSQTIQLLKIKTCLNLTATVPLIQNVQTISRKIFDLKNELNVPKNRSKTGKIFFFSSLKNIKKKNQNKLKRHKLEKIVRCGTCLNSSSFRKKRRNSKVAITRWSWVFNIS
ncbi:hypothetical protein BpHYR1_023844 [Brachionus plicatilis]|uniref:Uncharacterized protein n=1 Tax=Brachionus plicatilis TaxID=10195 RepID=A0A3M7S540_BRAPC|nr:hypothetical protein BpHYR1_023844 [Brachionus plicatilis]